MVKAPRDNMQIIGFVLWFLLALLWLGNAVFGTITEYRIAGLANFFLMCLAGVAYWLWLRRKSRPR